jgi:hypothetical protein
VQALYILAGIVITVAIVMGLLDSGKVTGRRSLAAWTCVVGGGVYGLGLFDSGLLPHFEWGNMAAVIGVSLIILLWPVKRRTGK